MFESIEIIASALSDFVAFIIIGIASVIGIAVRGYFKSIKIDQCAMQKCLNNVNDRGIRQSKALLDLAEHGDNETKRLHPDRSQNPIFTKMNRNLRDEKGKL